MKTKTALRRVQRFIEEELEEAKAKGRMAATAGLITTSTYFSGKVHSYKEVLQLCNHLLEVHERQKKERNKA